MATFANSHFHAPGNISVVSCGRFYLNGSSSPATVVGLDIKSVARTATGTYKVSLKEPWRKSLCLKAILAHNTADANDVVVVSHQVTSATDPSFVVKVVNPAGAAQDVAANANAFVMLRMILAQGSVF